MLRSLNNTYLSLSIGEQSLSIAPLEFDPSPVFSLLPYVYAPSAMGRLLAVSTDSYSYIIHTHAHCGLLPTGSTSMFVLNFLV